MFISLKGAYTNSEKIKNLLSSFFCITIKLEFTIFQLYFLEGHENQNKGERQNAACKSKR